ncbi:hypothetical protein [Massilia sp. Mn16-1_5]|uniref:hypothetical protein n=1 Tax=Massilia sp. Mn16-1_5 TaxID=2079199 RepID=UPI00109E648E|nr:hypothetical protein [Massilia sp. Mn16-1_5]THC39565.1 hypothetical protein C2862_23765 [Massilia sp. Mn16-1_5]
MPAFIVFIATFLLSHLLFLWVYTDALAQASSGVFVLCALALGSVFGGIAGFWTWTHSHKTAFLTASFLSALMALLPFLLNTYGMAIVALPLVFLWVWANSLGMNFTKRLRNRSVR